MTAPIQWVAGPRKLAAATITPEQVARMVELLPTVDTLAELREIVGLSSQTVSRQMAPFIAVMRLQGTLPPCRCGRERFHRTGCIVSIKKRDCAFPGHRREDWPRLIARRELIRAMLVGGERLVDIDAAVGDKKGSAARALQRLTQVEQVERDAAIKARGRGRETRSKPRRLPDDSNPADPSAGRSRWLIPGSYAPATGTPLGIGEFV